MKKIILLCSFCLPVTISLAQKETFDLATYTAPKGWKKEVKETVIGYQISDNKKKTWCRISIYKSTDSKVSIQQNFESEWQELIATVYRITEGPQVNDVKEANGRQIKAGIGKFSFNNKVAKAMLTTIAGFGKTISIVSLTNSNDYMPDIEKLLASVDLKIPNTNNVSSNNTNVIVQTTASNGYSFSTSNFDDGWNGVIKNDWVEVSKGTTIVLLHFGITMTDEIRMNITNACWNQLAATKYTIKNLYPSVYSVTKDFPYYFIQADATEKLTGKNVFVSFRVIPKNGVAYCYEIITPTKNEFMQQFSIMDKIENMSYYNRFAIGKNDLIGTWQEGAGAFTQYYYVSTGNYAGMNITVSNLKYFFTNASSYKTEVKAVDNNIYASEKENGKYSVSNWEVSTTDQNGKVSNFSAWFEATKGGRILHFLNKKYSSEHYMLGKVK
jgi:hypothetical protein